MVQKLDCLKLINFIENTDYFINKKIVSKKILIAFSGGQDSTCLLIIFYILSKKWGFKLGVVYCNHCWTDWKKTTLPVLKSLQKLDLPFYFVEAPFSKPLKPEQKARNWRYSAFDTILKWGNYDFLLTGHTLSDCVETTLFNLCRGSGLKGVCSLTESQRFSIPRNEDQFDFKKTYFHLPQSVKRKVNPTVFSGNGSCVQYTNPAACHKMTSFFGLKCLTPTKFFKVCSKKFFKVCSKKFFPNKSHSKTLFEQIVKRSSCDKVAFFEEKSFFQKRFRTKDFFGGFCLGSFHEGPFVFKRKWRMNQKGFLNQGFKSFNHLRNKDRLILKPQFLLLRKKNFPSSSFLTQKLQFKFEVNSFEHYIQKVKKVQSSINQISVITFFNPVFRKKNEKDQLFFLNSQIQKLLRKKK